MPAKLWDALERRGLGRRLGRRAAQPFDGALLAFKFAKQILFFLGYFALAPLLVNLFARYVLKSDFRVGWRLAAFFD